MDKILVKQFIDNYKEVFGGDSYITELEKHLEGGNPANAGHICDVCNSYRYHYGFDDELSEVVDAYGFEINPYTLEIKECRR